MLDRDFVNRPVFDRAGVRKQYIELPAFTLHGGEQAIEILLVDHITAHGHRVTANLRDSFIEFRLAPSKNEDMSSLVCESLSGSEPDAAVSACDDGRLAL